MQEALGLVETVGISTAIEIADVMVKAANVKILEMENSRGSGYMTVKIVGDVGAVKAAVDAAKAAGLKYGNLVSTSVIARPADGMAKTFCNPKVPYQRANGYNKITEKVVEKKEEPEAKVKPEVKAEPKAESKVEPKAEAKEEPKVVVKPEPVKETKVEEKTEPKQEPKKEVKAEEKPAAKTTPKTTTKTKSDSAKKTTKSTKTSNKKGTK